MPTRPKDRHRLATRHPITGELLWATRLPFGYSRSPEYFCELTEGLADEWRCRWRSLQECGEVPCDAECDILAFVDDFLIGGDDEELTKRGGILFEELLEERHIQLPRYTSLHGHDVQCQSNCHPSPVQPVTL